MSLRTVGRRLAAVVDDCEDVHLVYLFGSRAEGLAGPISDYDVAVLLARGADSMERQAELAYEFARVVEGDRVDVVVLNRAPIELAYMVIANGQLLYERDAATRVDYESKILGLYGDYLPMLRAHRDDVLRGDDHARRVHRYREALGRTERTLGEIRAAYRQTEE